MFLLGLFLATVLHGLQLSTGQVTCPAPIPPSKVSFTADPTDVCMFYLCYRYNGNEQMSRYKCPSDAIYLTLLLNSNPGSDFMILTACGGCNTGTAQTTPTTMAATTPVKTAVEILDNSHIQGGKLIGRFDSVVDCRLQCIRKQSCLAFDYDSNTRTCWYHDNTTACNPVTPKPTCLHFKYTTCTTSTSSTTTTSTTSMTSTTTPTAATTPTTPTTMTTPTTTPVPVTTPTMTTPSTTTTAAVTQAPGVPNGFVSAAPGMSVPGGRRMLVFVSEQQCLDFCLMESFCLAVDYDITNSGCYIHFRGTYCRTPQPLAGTNHYQRLPCVTGAANVGFEMRNKFHVLGGTESGRGLTLETCLTLCYLDSTCGGIDFDSRGGICHIFNLNNVCDPLLPKDYCIHVSLKRCSFIPGSAITAATTPIATTAAAITTPFTVPVGTFIQLTFPGPSSLPSGWQAYPGMQVANGYPLGVPGMSGDACVNLCNNDPACHSVDFNSGDGSCYGLDINQKCNVLVAINEVYHAKRNPPCLSVTGSPSTMYPSPLGIAP